MTDKAYLLAMGSRIKSARKSAGVNLRELGKLTGLSYVNLSYIENGHSDCHIITLKKISEAMGVDAQILLP